MALRESIQHQEEIQGNFQKQKPLLARDLAQLNTALAQVNNSIVALQGSIAINESALANATEQALRSVILPESLTELAGLNDCSALETVSLPKKLKKLGDKAFSGCAALRDINLPDSVSTVGDYAFSRCTSLTEPIYTKKGKCLWFVPMNATEFIMPDTVEKIAPTLMYNHKMLKSVVLSTRLKKISAGAFNDCAKLENIVIPEGVQEIERFAFNKCVSLTHVEIPASLTTIRRQAFQECQSLSSFTWTGTGPTKVTDDIFFACPLHGKRIPGMPNL